MTKGLPQPMAELIEEFSKMPGIGKRSAQRLTFYILQASKNQTDALLRSMREVKENIKSCTRCNNLSDKDLCSICSNESRDKTKICVVEDPSGVIALEKSSIYNGLYHVLLGELSPIDGVGPEALKIEGLISKVKENIVKEVIVATDFTTEGETTALYIFEILKPFNVKVTRLARGVPVGGNLEYADVATLSRAFEERR